MTMITRHHIATLDQSGNPDPVYIHTLSCYLWVWCQGYVCSLCKTKQSTKQSWRTRLNLERKVVTCLERNLRLESKMNEYMSWIKLQYSRWSNSHFSFKQQENMNQFEWNNNKNICLAGNGGWRGIRIKLQFFFFLTHIHTHTWKVCPKILWQFAIQIGSFQILHQVPWNHVLLWAYSNCCFSSCCWNHIYRHLQTGWEFKYAEGCT